jgi:hypothetical protein
MSNRGRKDEVKKLLERRDFDALRNWVEKNRNPFRVLLSLTYDAEEIVRRRAIDAVGKVAGVVAAADIEKVRDFVRRLLWLMNDESGGLGWHAPEMIGEILVNVPTLIDDTAELLPSFMKEEPFELGTHLAMSRVAMVDAKPFIKSGSEIVKSLGDSDPLIRSYAASILGAIGDRQYSEAVRALSNDNTEVTMYDFEKGDWGRKTVAEFARRAIEQIELSDQAA